MHQHSGKDIQDIVLRGEYLYTANGPGGLEVFDVANIDQKGFSERVVKAPFSPLGQNLRADVICDLSGSAEHRRAGSRAHAAFGR